jgi:hypothetical protein
VDVVVENNVDIVVARIVVVTAWLADVMTC